MYTKTPFLETRDLIVVPGMLAGPRGQTTLRLAVDTAATSTLITPEVADRVGYGARHGGRLMAVSSPLGREHGFRLRVRQLTVLGFAFRNASIGVFDLTDHDDIDGLLGLNLLEFLDYEVQSSRRCILAQPTAIISQG